MSVTAMLLLLPFREAGGENDVCSFGSEGRRDPGRLGERVRELFGGEGKGSSVATISLAWGYVRRLKTFLTLKKGAKPGLRERMELRSSASRECVRPCDRRLVVEVEEERPRCDRKSYVVVELLEDALLLAECCGHDWGDRSLNRLSR